MSGSQAHPSSGSLIELVRLLLSRWKLLLAVPLAAGVMALGITYVVKPTFTARTSFIPPQQGQSAAMSALASLGSALPGLAAGAANIRTPADQYVALMQSVTVEDVIVEAFNLREVYGVDLKTEARLALEQNVRISLGRRDGLITVEVDDKSPQRAADIANRYVEELRKMASRLVLTEAQQRRVFFEGELKQTRERFQAAQRALEASGFNASTLRAEPRSIAEGYARMKAETTAAEARLQALRRNLTDDAPEVTQQAAVLATLRAQLAQVEASQTRSGGSDYIGKYREFKYQEALLDLLSRQFEMARLDASREGALIQVVDAATAPEKKSKPRRGMTAVATTVAVALLLAVLLVVQHLWRIHGSERTSS